MLQWMCAYDVNTFPVSIIAFVVVKDGRWSNVYIVVPMNKPIIQ